MDLIKDLPEGKDQQEQTYYMKGTYLSPRLHNTLARQVKGTSKLINHRNNGKYEPFRKVIIMWSMRTRIEKAGKKLEETQD